jgi:CHAD domain-containing protein
MAETEQAVTADTIETTREAQPAPQSPTLAEIITSQLETLQAHHQAVLETDDPEAIHKMRVTTRRLQASLDLLGHEFHAHRLKRRLREWRRMLSLVRNYDVFIILIEKEAASHRSSQRGHYELVKSILHKRRQRRAARVRRYMQKVKIDAIARKLGLPLTSAVSESSSPPEVDPTDAIEKTPKEPVAEKRFALDEARIYARIAERLEQRMAEFNALAAQSHPSTDAADLHQLRIAAKRVRYLLEIISQLGYGDSSRVLGWLRTLQDRIGDWHDLEAVEEEVINIVARRRFMKEHLTESSRMLLVAAHLQKKKVALVSKLFPVRVPRTLTSTAQRVVKALRRSSMNRRGGLQLRSRQGQP